MYEEAPESTKGLHRCIFRWGLCECVLRKASASPDECQHKWMTTTLDWQKKRRRFSVTYLPNIRIPPLMTFWILLCLLIHGYRGNTSQNCVWAGVSADRTSTALAQPTSTTTSQSHEAEPTPPKKTKRILASFLKTLGAVTATSVSPFLRGNRWWIEGLPVHTKWNGGKGTFQRLAN